MRPCSVRPGVRRTWTVELRPQPGGPVLVCQQCTRGGRPLVGSAARSELLAHLAAHARQAPLPAHLRTCPCHERGCRQHPRHRGCDGPIRLLLVRERGGRRWRLSDACTACAAATSQAAVVPETTLVPTATPSGQARARRRRCPRGPDSQTRVREMLNYLATALPRETGAGARMLALQCALRMNDSAQVRLPYGMLRSLRLGSAADSWRELHEAGLLRTRPSDHRAMKVQILEAALLTQHPARPDRLRAADWALRGSCPARTFTPLLRLAALSLVVRTAHTSDHGVAETEHVARECGVPAANLPSLLEQLATAGVLMSWQAALDTGEVSWRLGTKGLHPHSAVEDTN
ncbi:hypothetical protein OIE08_05170 [Streptomyces canus]